MQKSGSVNRNSSLRVMIPQAPQSLRRLGLCSQIATGGPQQSSPIVFPEKRSKKVKASSKHNEVTNDTQVKPKVDEHRIDIGGGDEKSNLLGCLVYSGKLVLDKRKSVSGKSATDDQQSSSPDIPNKQAVDAKLTSRALVWGSHMLQLDDVVSVTYNVGLRHFTVHAYPFGKGSCGLSCFMKPKRSRKDFRFLAPTIEEAVQWVASFADQQCFVNCLPHPLVSSKKQASSELLTVPIDTPPELIFRCKSPPKMLVILNPRSGHGRSSKVFHDIVEPIFKLAGFKLEVVKTTKAGHARELASTVDINACSDGIICVGGDGIINEVLNGLLSRSNHKERISIPIGIIPAGSDNSLVWTVLGVRDPISAAISIVKGGLTATDVFAVEWIQTGVIHFGMTASYYGFVSDVLELSGKYQKRFGPLRYFIAGFLKFMCLPKYSYEVEYLPAQKEGEGKNGTEKEVIDMQYLYMDIMRRSSKEGMPRASSLSSIDSIMTPSRMSGGELDTGSSTHASTEPSEYVRGIDPKAKRLSSGRSNVTVAEPEVIHPQLPLSTTPNWPRTRSKSRTDKGWAGLTTTVQDPSARCSWGNAGANDREDISSTLSDPGPIWDAEPKWDSEPSAWNVENSIELPGPPEDGGMMKEEEEGMRFEDKWVAKKGNFLGILVCNHACRTVQSSQVVAPTAEHDDRTMDMILVNGSGRLRLMRFFVLLQLGRHLSLPYVEYVKVRSVRIRAGSKTHNGCGIDGELFPLNGEVISSMLPDQCRLIGHHPGRRPRLS
ncbi:PREDICTED: sphingoid long-chain bases kinase 1 [Tarenaya hassleriana]|uniref:sphingoid long-chain bases kinase 1 n=1 Tax=Tarenaya hassleriana TaxID=28532 RepID=UPI00053C1C63|nr:PREDICTED: sphingoid long-chain bases kinase 1 [Tarenaya hassleriana]